MRPVMNTGTYPEPCLPLGLDADPGRELDRLFVDPVRLSRRERLYQAGAAFTALYVLRRGSLKTVVLGEDGREHITGYHMAGDIVGLEALGHPSHMSDAVALEESELASLPLACLDEIGQDPRLSQDLFQLMARDLRRRQDLILLLGGATAEERVTTLLLNLARRQHGLPPGELLLRMTREEIASFLGLKLETVSRMFSRLQVEGLLRVHGRAVSLLDPAGLRRVAVRHQ